MNQSDKLIDKSATTQDVLQPLSLKPIQTVLWNKLEAYLEVAQLQFAFRAYQFSALAHQGQKRRSGIPYICHPLSVAENLADMRMDAKTIAAALLHDVIEDTAVTKHALALHFGNDVAEMVDGVTKLAQIKFTDQAEKEAENLRKMLMAMTHDIRIIIIKLADRLHNMSTLAALPSEKQRRIAKETLEIYTPIANRLGMNELKLTLEELGFKYLYPDRYRVLAKTVKKARGNQQDIVTNIETTLSESLNSADIKATVAGREKHLYSLYKKMRYKQLSFSDILDIYAFRIVVNSVSHCYQALGIIHSLFKPIPGKFKDYIALPKTNGYQSLHTILIGPHGVPVEVQIRSDEMDNVSENGIAAHWTYKQGSDSSGSQRRAREWLRQLLDTQQQAGTPSEFLKNIKVDLFPDQVYVFTPKGKVLALPYGATPVDFAYAVHSDIGDHCVSARLNYAEVSLTTRLSSGQRVEISTDENARPDPNWLNFIVTIKARNYIRHTLKTLKKDEAIVLGERLLNAALQEYDITLKSFSDEHTKNLLQQLALPSMPALHEKLGSGQLLAPIVCRALIEESGGKLKKSFIQSVTGLLPKWMTGESTEKTLVIQGTEGMVVSYARCCQPIPGDPIRGVISSGKGVVVHRDACKNVRKEKIEKGALLTMRWDEQPLRNFPVDVRVDINNQLGTLATVAAAIAAMEANIDNIDINHKNAKISTLIFTVLASDRAHLANVIRHVRKLDCVKHINRLKR